MANAKIDDNRNPALLAVSSVNGETPVRLEANPSTGALLVSDSALQSLVGLEVPAHDYVAVTYPTTSTEVYTYKTGGVGGTTVATVTLVYSDAVTKLILTSVART